MTFLPVSTALIIVLYAFLALREKQADDKLCAVLLFKYSTCLLFAIVGYLYFRGRGFAPGFWILSALVIAASLAMGKDIRMILREKEVTEDTFRIVQRTSLYITGLTFGLVAAILLSM